MSNSKERWFDGEVSETYLGTGHQDETEFAAWATEEELRADSGAGPIGPESVKHLWARWRDYKPHEWFNLCAESDEGAFPITQVIP